jgi:hypothetical protein
VNAPSLLGRLDERIREALDTARGNAAALARSGHEVLEVAQAEPTPTANGVTGRARLLDAESVRVSLTAASLHQHAGRVAAYGVVLEMLDQLREEDHAAARGRVEAEAARDAATYREAVERDGENDGPEQWAADAFDSWVEVDARAIEPLTTDEARALYLAQFRQTLRGAG